MAECGCRTIHPDHRCAIHGQQLPGKPSGTVPCTCPSCRSWSAEVRERMKKTQAQRDQ